MTKSVTKNKKLSFYDAKIKTAASFDDVKIRTSCEIQNKAEPRKKFFGKPMQQACFRLIWYFHPFFVLLKEKMQAD